MPSALARAQSGNDLFQQALAKERSEGKPRDAVELYRRVIAEYPNDRALVARALVQLGRTQEQIGATEARKAYERVLSEFADQREPVEEARRRIALLQPNALESPQPGVATTRKVLVSDGLTGSTVTTDGRSLVFVDSTGNVAVKDLRNGQVVQATHTTANWDEYADHLAASHDAQTIAYAWWNGPKTVWELRVTVRRGAPRVLINDSTIAYTRPYALTGDGRFVVASVSPRGRPSELSLVDVATGARQVLATVAGTDPQNMAISPDGRYLVYDTRADTTSQGRDIRIVTIASRADTVLIRHPADDYGPYWGPGGTGLFFVSSRNGTRAGWFVNVRDGRTTGTPVLVRPDIGTGSQLALTRDGALYYTPMSGARQDVYVLEVDSSLGTSVKAPELVVSRTNGANLGQSWSRDGRFLAYIAGRGQDQGIRIRAVDTGAESEVRAPTTGLTVQLTPDNRSAVIENVDRRRGTTGLYQIDLSSGTSRMLVEKPSATHSVRFPVPSADGRSVYYVLSGPGDGRSIVHRDIATGVERTLYPAGDAKLWLGQLALSPDGQWIAVAQADRQGDRDGSRIVLVPVGGGNASARILARIETTVGSVSWTPDGRSVVAFTNANGAKLWAVPTDGSSPRKLGVTFPQHTVRAQLHPDGRRLALRVDDYTAELWVAEHFLPDQR